jgi:Tol biopolymer transport system component
MAPEQRVGKPCDARTDIYALGLVMSEMATGVRVPAGGSPTLDALPDKLGHTVARCLAQDPEDRWQSARDLKAEIEWAAKDAGSQASAATAARPRRTWTIPAAVLGAAAMTALGALAGTSLRQPVAERRTMVSSILPPAKTSFDFAANFGPVALSPDGTRMVFAATGEDGASRLWLRALDAAEAQALPGTDHGTFPFWSPDNRWVAFYADGFLKKVDTRGGAPVPLAVVNGNGIGGSWSAKGEIVFAANTFSPMLKVSQDGGDTTIAVETDVSGHGFPWFLPGGDHFLFASWTGAGRMTIRVGSLGSTTSTEVGEADSNAIYADGYLLYLRGDSLVAQAFDLQSLRATGDAVPVTEHVGRFMNLVGAGVFSASQTGLLAYQTGGNAAEWQLTWFDRAGRPAGTLGGPLAYFDVEFSPDGRTMIASAPDAVGNFDLWTYDLARGVPRRLTTDPAGEYYGVWSADGRTIIFNSTRKGHYDLYRKAANGAGPEELVYADNTDKVPVSWSHDGRYLLYYTGGGAQYRLFVLRLTPDQPGGPLTPTPLLDTAFNEGNARFSPDDRWVAYTTDESGRSEVYVAPFARPAEKVQISTDGGQYPRWRPDGRGLFFQGAGRQLREAELRIAGGTVEVTSVTPVFGRAGVPGGYGYDVSADGQRALAASPVTHPIEPITLMENWPAALKH